MKRTGRRLLVPEVVQTSAMDCGPAALKSLLEGHRIHASYGHLRDTCQTDVDGSSIDTMEKLAVDLGLDAEQVMLPADHVLLAEAAALPAIVVVQLPTGAPHFIVVWSRFGRLVQLMDPATGRRWTTADRFLSEVYEHRMPVSAAGWREWAGSDEARRALLRRLRAVGLSDHAARTHVENALSHSDWHLVAAIDATARMVAALRHSAKLGRVESAAVFARLLPRAVEEAHSPAETIPERFWSVTPAEPDKAGQPQLWLRGAVLVRIRGVRPRDLRASGTEDATAAASRNAVLEAVQGPGRELVNLLRADGLISLGTMGLGLGVAAAAVVFEALLFRGLFGASAELTLFEHRLGTMGLVVGFAAIVLGLEFPLTANVLRAGRHLETRLRMAFLLKARVLGDRYFQGRLTSDLAERVHTVHTLREMPDLGARLLRSVFELAATATAIVWIDPASAVFVLAAAALAVAVPIAAQPLLAERDLRFRTHAGALTRFYLDGLLGLAAIRSHGAERAVRYQHGVLTEEWRRAGLLLQRSAVWMDFVQSLTGFWLAALILVAHLERGGAASSLLLVYWALKLPVLGDEIAMVARQYPAVRNVTLRLLEPLTMPAAHQERDESRPPGPAPPDSGVALRFDGVSVRAGGRDILSEVSLTIAPGEHVAVVGRSGAGKSTLAGLVLGWREPWAGAVLVNGRELAGETLRDLRRHTAWVDPAVRLWNRPLIDNLQFGSADHSAPAVAFAIQGADLATVLARLPDGLQSILGEGGGLLSGGEGQRVRFGRALARPDVRLVVLDEPFRGLSRAQRSTLLRTARGVWSRATLLCVTHDIAETVQFSRVVVVESGRVIEDGNPEILLTQPDSHYRALRDAEDGVRDLFRERAGWRALKLENGQLVPSEPAL